jgi:hypothetical protein
MTDRPEPSGFLTPSAVLTSLAALLTGGLALGFNPLFAVSAVAMILAIVTLRSARHVRHDIVQGVLRIFAIIGIMGAVGGVMVILFPTLGVNL